MAVVDIQGAPPRESRFKGAAPVAAGALGIVAAIIGAVSLTGPEAPAPIPAPFEAPLEAPLAANPPAPPQPGGAVNMGMEIVVKFKDDSKVKDIIDAFGAQQVRSVESRSSRIRQPEAGPRDLFQRAGAGARRRHGG